MSAWPTSQTPASSEAVFGSAVRGDVDTLSDRDILILDDDVRVLRRRSAELEAAGWSVASYTFGKFNAISERGALFIQHLKLESEILVDRNRRLAHTLQTFKPLNSYTQEIQDNCVLASLAGCVPRGPRGVLFAADVLYVTVRNFGILSLAERGVHTYAFGSVVRALEAEGLVAPGGASALAALRFLKCLYRSGEGGGSNAQSTVQAALKSLPTDYFPNEMRIWSVEEILNADAPFNNLPAYFQPRDMERRLVAFQSLMLPQAASIELAQLSRWIENPRAYASLSSRLAPKLRDTMKHWFNQNDNQNSASLDSSGSRLDCRQRKVK